MNTLQQEQKNFLLVCVEKPVELAAGHGACQWNGFYGRLASTPDIVKMTVLHFENFWLYPEEKAWPCIEQIKSAAIAFRLWVRVYRIRGMPEVVE
jgi:hypothetical protein